VTEWIRRSSNGSWAQRRNAEVPEQFTGTRGRWIHESKNN